MTTPYTGNGPDDLGFFGQFGGCYMPESLMPALQELEQAFNTVRHKPEFWAEYQQILTDFVGRPSPLFYAKNLTAYAGGARIYFKREDLNHTGAHKINNCVGQILLAKFMGKTRIIAETGAGQHGVATATVCALFKMKCTIFMGETDIQRQQMNVERMKLLGAEVRSVQKGRGTLKDAMNEALRDWIRHVDTTYYLLGTGAGPHPYPTMVREFQKIIGLEARNQILLKENRLPDALVACVGGGSNALGLMHPFLEDLNVKMFGVEAGGKGTNSGEHAASICKGQVGVLHGNLTYLLQDSDGQILEGHSISAGLDYPGVGPEHGLLFETGRVTYTAITDQEAVNAFQLLSQQEGIIPALESSHAIAYAIQLAQEMQPEQIIIVNLSGRGDKDLNTVKKYLAGATA
ncbi:MULTISPECIES: tryptophan synthase subunit beta [Acinetobacter]|jgi:tryptophan synthase beta chain|uniref:Tryptophan synthase beta chain n=1 Tax=Acinetobacter johnsonii TaxID=40214 RepID=A0AAJ6IDG9_ACIJO|nr:MULTISPECIES: tryptophan synthase subunit beta [Acinetobacter]ALV73712.1 tryptophan synthase subunit beta [Acinetobacter johnsonii XBB1]MBO7705527.1 tryptophan synthase subunit beta [Acinetobacter sp.]MCM5532812.1 tryptophan synthase subunit beta [Acinetobacter pittii]MCR3924286.1 tryptophan synthase subunit beta [Acinetobacter pittii]MCV2452284.1 tryptophan synthase subunit beta [Acinetobacter johnsonii]